MRRSSRYGALAALWLLACGVPAGAQVAVLDAWIPETPPGAAMAAAFLAIANHGEAPRTLIGAESPAGERIEIHRTETKGGVARMRRQESLVVPAGGRVVLEAGGLHMMLVRPRPLRAGERVPIELDFADGEKVTVEAEVRARAGHAH